MYNKKPFQGGRSGDSRGGRSFGGGKPWERGGSTERHGGGGSSYGGARSGGFDKPTLFPAVCAECGTRCEVPFKPNGKKPVLCGNCFKRDGGAPSFDGPKRFNDRPERSSFGGGSSYGADRAPRASGGNDEAMKAINAKLDAILAILRDEDGDEA